MGRGDRRWWGLGLGACLVPALMACGEAFTMKPQGGPPHLPPVTDGVPRLDAGESCGPYSAPTLMHCVEASRITADVEAIAQPRPPASSHHLAVRELCAQRLRTAGYEVTLQNYGTGINVVGVKPGFSKPEERVLLSAHYDHLPGCAGADDNASGVAALLETARVLATGRFDRSVVIACWDEGERGQLGSGAYARQARAREERLVAVFSYEAVGYTSSEPGSQKVPKRFEEAFPDEALSLLESDYRANFLTVVAETATESSAAAVVRHGRSLGLPVHVLSLTERQKVKQDKIHRSDHVSFWNAGFPALLLTDTGSFRNPHLHCLESPDRADTLDYPFIAMATRAGLGAAVELLQLR